MATRLSLQAAAEVLEQYADGVWLVELAALSDPTLVPQTVADILGIREALGEPITRTLLSVLKDKQILLVLDNCEHLLDASASLVDALHQSCPKISLLVSSREALGVGGESTYRVPSLSVPDLKQAQTPQNLSEYESVRLFIERAVSVKTDFVVTPQNAMALASVCHHLDGIPLAIELAAARVRAMSMEKIEARLDCRFRLLTGGLRTALPRQQTLKALIDWSYDLLNELEKTLFGRLSVFVGGWTLEAAEAVCTGTEIEDFAVLDLLTSLVDKSLVQFSDGGSDRYSMLETMREYAREQQDKQSESEYIRERYRDYFLALAEEAQSYMGTPDENLWLNRLDIDLANMRAALQWGTDDATLRLAVALSSFWYIRGHFSEGRERLDHALESTSTLGHPATRAKAFYWTGRLASLQGDYLVAQERIEKSLENNDDQRGIAAAYNILGNLANYQGNRTEAQKKYRKSLEISSELGDKERMAVAYNNLGVVADELTEQAQHYNDSLKLQRELGNERGIAYSLGSLGMVAAFQGDLPESQRLLEEAQELLEKLGDRRGLATTLSSLGNLALERSDYARARSYYAKSLNIQRDLGDIQSIACSLESFAHLAVANKEMDRGSRLNGTAEALRKKYKVPLMPRQLSAQESRIAIIRTELDESAFKAAWVEGKTMALEQAIKYAIED